MPCSPRLQAAPLTGTRLELINALTGWRSINEPRPTSIQVWVPADIVSAFMSLKSLSVRWRDRGAALRLPRPQWDNATDRRRVIALHVGAGSREAGPLRQGRADIGPGSFSKGRVEKKSQSVQLHCQRTNTGSLQRRRWNLVHLPRNR